MANRGLNHITLMGHLGGDARRIQSSRGFGCTFNLATTRRYKRGDSWTDETTWVRCSFWNSENVFEFLKQGRQIVIEGHLVNFPYKDSGGKDLKLMEVSVDALILTDYRSRGGSEAEETDSTSEDEQAQAQAAAPSSAEMQRIREYEAHVKAQAAQAFEELEAREQALEKRVAALDAGLAVEGAAPEKGNIFSNPASSKPRAKHVGPSKRAVTAPRRRG